MPSYKYLQLNNDGWKKARMRALVRDNFICQAHQLGMCDSLCTETRLHMLEVHHIKMRIQGGTHELENLITLCKQHHQNIHPWMKRLFPLKKELKYPRKEL
jgi:5-methylcytosine-specific restriction endonuclease McrA